MSLLQQSVEKEAEKKEKQHHIKESNILSGRSSTLNYRPAGTMIPLFS